jgi:hypothetical protein
MFNRIPLVDRPLVVFCKIWQGTSDIDETVFILDNLVGAAPL